MYFFFQGTVEPRIAKQRWAPQPQKEIIDLEETVCLPRYQCGKNIRSSADFNTAYTDTLNDVIVSSDQKIILTSIYTFWSTYFRCT